MKHSLWSRILLVTGLFVCSAASSRGQVLENEALLRKQEDQQRARTLTRELLANVLDVQLRQLDENGLSDQEIYRDIKLMRQNLNHLVEMEMTNVVDLLAEAQRLPGEKREALFVDARQQIRTVVRQLAVQRQNLLKRLKIVELVEQVRNLIHQQSTVQKNTRAVRTEAQSLHEILTLRAIEDQRDVKELYLHLIDTLVDMKTWSGSLSSTAADALRILNVTEVGPHLDSAGRHLQSVQHSEATDEQGQVIKGLQELLRVVEQTQEGLGSEFLANIDRVRGLMERQKQLRDETKLFDDQQPPPPDFVEQQALLQRDIAGLAEVIPKIPKGEALLQLAEAAALDAAASLLDGRLETAISSQGQVLGNLAALELTLREQAKQSSPDRSAEELAESIKRLHEAKAALNAAKLRQPSVRTDAGEQTQATAAQLTEIIQATEAALENPDLPANVLQSLTRAKQSASAAMTALEAATSETDSQEAAKSLTDVAHTLDRALATVDSAIADTERRESAVKIGELARAAEVLERAASEERQIAVEVDALAEPGSATASETAEQARHLAARQDDVHAIAEKTAKALAQIAAEASQHILAGAADAKDSSQKLQSIADQTAGEPASAAEIAAESARKASQNLADAAKLARKLVVTTAQELAQKTSEQAEQIATARAAVDRALDDLPSSGDLAKLDAARNELNTAIQQQATASGKPAAALALQLVHQIASGIEAQQAATEMALAAQAGATTELKATIKEEEAAESALMALDTARKFTTLVPDLSESTSGSLIQSLDDAHQGAAQAARQILESNPSGAMMSQAKSAEALRAALVIAQSEAQTTVQQPPTHPSDLQAQADAAATTKQAQAFASQASQVSASAVHPAVEATASAERALVVAPREAGALQATAEAKLQEALRHLVAAVDAATREREKRLAELADQHEAMAEEVAAADPAAADSIDVAAQAARRGSHATESSTQVSEAEADAEMALEQASANLGAREQEIRRDQAIAETVASLAQGQQLAADTIAEQSAELERMAEAMEEASTEQQRAAAQSLNEAKQQFADSQRATGQGAVELSGQKEVANLPLREALELASMLPTEDAASEDPLDGLLPQPPTDSKDSTAPDVADAGPSPPSAQAEQGTEGPAVSPSEAGQSAIAKPGKASSGKPNDLGTGFVPQSPQLTADMMAGAKAQRAARKALGQQMPKLSQQADGQQSESGKVTDGDQGEAQSSEHSESSKLSKNEGTSTTNQGVKDGPIQREPEGTSATSKPSDKARETEDKIEGKQSKEAAWFARLPPELRKSLRAGTGQKPPRAYEERLKNYLQSVD